MRRRFGLVLAAALLTFGCGGSDSPTGPTPNPDPPPSAVLTLACPAGVSASTTGAPVPVSYAAPTATGGQAPVTVACVPPSGSAFPMGASSVACTATDARAATASCGFQVVVSRVPQLTRTKFLAFGDSVTLGEVTVPTTTSAEAERFPFGKLQIVPAAAYPTQLRTMLVGRYTGQTADIVMTNAGRSGEAAVDGALRFPNVIANTRPDVVLLLEGYNDLNLYGTSGISRAVAALESMAKESRFRGARVFIGTLTPPRPGAVNSITTFNITEFNTRLRNMAAGEGATVVDLYGALLSNVTTYIGVDGLHPTEAGYRRMAEEYFAAIRANLEQP